MMPAQCYKYRKYIDDDEASSLFEEVHVLLLRSHQGTELVYLVSYLSWKPTILKNTLDVSLLQNIMRHFQLPGSLPNH